MKKFLLLEMPLTEAVSQQRIVRVAVPFFFEHRTTKNIFGTPDPVDQPWRNLTFQQKNTSIFSEIESSKSVDFGNSFRIGSRGSNFPGRCYFITMDYALNKKLRSRMLKTKRTRTFQMEIQLQRFRICSLGAPPPSELCLTFRGVRTGAPHSLRNAALAPQKREPRWNFGIDQ